MAAKTNPGHAARSNRRPPKPWASLHGEASNRSRRPNEDQIIPADFSERLSAAQILQLQRTVGNRAVREIVTRRQARPELQRYQSTANYTFAAGGGGGAAATKLFSSQSLEPVAGQPLAKEASREETSITPTGGLSTQHERYQTGGAGWQNAGAAAPVAAGNQPPIKVSWPSRRRASPNSSSSRRICSPSPMWPWPPPTPTFAWPRPAARP